MKTILTLVMTASLAMALVAAQSRSAADLFQEALRLEEVKGDLKAAIEQYRKLAQGGDRSIAAKALLQMAACYEKLGQSDARKTYERVAREFADQVESAATARTRLAALARLSDGTTAAGTVPRLVWGDASLPGGGGTISPDGRHLVYVGPGIALYVRDLPTGLNRRLTLPVSAGNTARPNGALAFSPDGKLIASGWWDREGTGRTEMRFLTLDGSAPPVFHQGHEWNALAPNDWSADGKQVLALGNHIVDGHTYIVLVSVTDGSVHELKALGMNYHHSRMMSLSRDGRHVVYDQPARGDSGERDIFILGAQGGQEARLVARAADDSYPVFAPDGTGVLFLGRRAPGEPIGAWYQRVGDGKPQGSPELLRAEMGTTPIPIGFTPNGSFYYYRDESAWKLFAATLDPANGTMAVQADTVTQRVVTFGPAWSPDGQYLAYGSQRPSVQGEVGASIIVIRSLATGQERELAPALSNFRIRTTAWSPDGRSLLAGGTDKSGRTGLYRVDSGTGDIARILDGIPSHFTWFLNGKALVFIRGNAIVLHELGTGRETELYRPSAPILLGSCVEVSGDGQRLAFNIRDPETRSSSVMVMTAPGEQPRELGPQVEYPGGISDILALTRDGRHVLFTTYDDRDQYKVWTIAVEGGVPQEIRLPMERLDYVGAVSVHPDGQRIAFQSSGPRMQSVRVLENFLPKAAAAR